MITVTDKIAIDEAEIQTDFIRASGPGGQNVNKVSSAVQLRFDVRSSPSLPDEVRERLERLARNRITSDGILIIEARQHRTQEQNRQDALDRLVRLVRQAAETPKERKKTKPPPGANRRRLEAKRKKGEIKRQRSWRPGDPT